MATLPRSGTGGTVPSTFTTGYRYAGPRLHDGVRRRGGAAQRAAVARRVRRHADRGRRVLRADGQRRVPAAADRRRRARARARVRRVAARRRRRLRDQDRESRRHRAVEAGRARAARGSTRRSARRRVTPRAILETLVDAANALGLPHAAHIHCNNLGVAGNVATTLDEHARRRAAGARTSRTCSSTATRSGGKTAAGDPARASSIEYVNAHPEVERRRRPGDVRPGDDADRRRPRRVPAAQEQRAASG